MKKPLSIIIAAIAVVGIAVGAYLVITDKSGDSDLDSKSVSAGQSAILSYVPADTPYFFGGLVPFDTVEWSALYKSISQAQTTTSDQLAETFGLAADLEDQGPAVRLLFGLYAEYINDLGKEKEFLSAWGLDGKLNNAWYSVGIRPVLRIEMPNLRQFSDRLRAVEENYNIQAEVRKEGDVNYRSYPFVNDQDDESAALVIAENGNTLVITIALDDDEQEQLAVTLGVTKPTESLSVTRLTSLADRYGFHRSFFGFIDHQAIAKGLTTIDGNALARDISSLIDKYSDIHELRAPECAQDFGQLAKSMPLTAFGYDTLDLKSSPMRADTLISFEINDAEVTDALKSLRGDLPQSLYSLSGPQKFSMGLGLNIDNLSSVIGLLSTRVSNATFGCDVLVDMQEGIMATNPMTITMATAMVAGLRGVSASVFDFEGDFEGVPPTVQTLDALIAISADNPEALMSAAMSTAPMLQGLPLPTPGNAVDVPLPMPPGVNVAAKLGLDDNHIFLFTGSKSEQAAAELGKEDLGEHGYFGMFMDYGWYFDTLMGLVEGQLRQEPSYDQEAMASLTQWFENIDMKISFVFDVQDSGLIFDVDSSMKVQ